MRGWVTDRPVVDRLRPRPNIPSGYLRLGDWVQDDGGRIGQLWSRAPHNGWWVVDETGAPFLVRFPEKIERSEAA